jgi:hypothetical protein
MCVIERLSSWDPSRLGIEMMRMFRVTARRYSVRVVRVRDLTAGMLLDEALITCRGLCLVPADMEVTPTLILRRAMPWQDAA